MPGAVGAEECKVAKIGGLARLADEQTARAGDPRGAMARSEADGVSLPNRMGYAADLCLLPDVRGLPWNAFFVAGLGLEPRARRV